MQHLEVSGAVRRFRL